MYDSMPLPDHKTAPDGMPDVAYMSCDSLQARSPLGGPQCSTNKEGCQYIKPDDPLKNDTMLGIRSAYAGAITWMDSQLGKVLDELEALGHMNDTVIMFWADHGWYVGVCAYCGATATILRSAGSHTRSSRKCLRQGTW